MWASYAGSFIGTPYCHQQRILAASIGLGQVDLIHTSKKKVGVLARLVSHAAGIGSATVTVNMIKLLPSLQSRRPFVSRVAQSAMRHKEPLATAVFPRVPAGCQWTTTCCPLPVDATWSRKRYPHSIIPPPLPLLRSCLWCDRHDYAMPVFYNPSPRARLRSVVTP